MLALALLTLGLARPPAAYVEPGHVRLAVSSWCWGSHCGAPIAPSGKSALLHRGSRVTVSFAFTPATVRVGVAGAAVTVRRAGKQISWTASRAGGMTINVTGAGGFVAYVGRLLVR
jgi:hypothetical protein